MTYNSNTKYQGWANYATWNVNLWLSNDEGLYQMVEEAKPVTVEHMKELCLEVWPTAKTPDNASLLDVDWVELTEMTNQ